jgi:serine/threonine-protein kinase
MRKIGRGGMADVYSARQISLGRDVAFKVLRSEHASDKDYVQRFRREARAAAKLNHPNIVQVYEVGTVDSHHYISQELIDGENLRERLDRLGAIDADLATEVLVGVASALQAATEAGVTHRDIKPENIMLSSSGLVKVADFGLARFGADVALSGGNLTQAGLTMGTPRYMSPEQVQGKQVDVRSDLYSLGVTMYHLLTGRPPFEADEPLALALMHLNETPEPVDRARAKHDKSGTPDLDEWLIATVNRLMSKSVDARFQSADELLTAVRHESPAIRLDNLGAGTAAATIRLQRATDLARRQTASRRGRLILAISLPLLCSLLTLWWVNGQTGPRVDDILRPQTVAAESTVQEQYLTAVIRGDEIGWRSVGKHFPPSASAINAAYFAKSQLQLASLLAAAGRVEDADMILKALYGDPNVDRIYQAVALVRRYLIQQTLNRSASMESVRREFQSLYSDLQANNPAVTEQLRKILSRRELLQMGIGDD